MIICGIDPGDKGGLALLDYRTGACLVVEPMAPPQQLVWILGKYDSLHVFIEKAQSFPKQGICSAFNYAEKYGVIQGVLIAMKIPYERITPVRWTNVMHKGAKGSDAKAKSLETCLRIFPRVNLLPTDRSKKPHDGMIDALLIAEYGRRHILGGNYDDSSVDSSESISKC